MDQILGCRSRSLQLFVAIVFLFCIAASAQQQFKLASIRVTGSNEFTEADIVRASGLAPGDLAGPADFQNAANKLTSIGAFANVNFSYSPVGRGIGVEFKVEDNPDFLPIRYENFVWASADELDSIIASAVPLFHGRVTQGGDMAQNVADVLAGWLRAKGVNAQVAFRLHAKGIGMSVDYLSYFVQGVPMIIRSATLIGAEHLLPDQRASVTQPMLGTEYEVSMAVDGTGYRITPLYERIGFLRAKPGTPAVQLTGTDAAHPELALTLPIDEGLQYTLAAVEVAGNSVLPDAELRSFIRSSPGTLADGALLRGDADALRKLYSSRGYISASVQPNFVFDDAARAVTATLRISEGPLFRMGRIEFVRQDGKSVERLLNAWKLKSGSVYNGDYLMQFLRANAAEVGGRNLKVVQTNGDANTVNIRIEF